MKKFALVAAIFAAVVGCGGEVRVSTPVQPPAVGGRPLTVADLYLSCVQVVARDASGRAMGRGSGTVIEKGRVLTAWHVVVGASQVTVERAGRTFYWGRPADVIAKSQQRDLALLSVDTGELRAIPVASDPPMVWQQCFAVGYAKGLSAPTLTDGRVQEWDEEDLRYSAPGWFGSSGGGVFVVVDGRFRLISVTQRVMLEPAHGGQIIEFLMLGAAQSSIVGFLKEAAK